jgi:anti-sigma factor RsiW
MNVARDTSECLRLERWINAYVDDELDAIHCCDVEEHLGSCGDCNERVALSRATRCSLKKLLKASAPAGLRERLGLLLDSPPTGVAPTGVAPTDDESARVTSLDGAAIGVLPSEQRSDEQRSDEQRSDEQRSDDGQRGILSAPPPALARLHYIVPLAAAATIALVFGAMQLQRAESQAAANSAATASNTVMRIASIDALLDDLVRQHIEAPPLDTTSVDDMNRYEPRFGVRLRVPELRDARWEGARMHQPAALMRYILRNRHRVTLYVFDSGRVPVAEGRVAHRHHAARNIFVGNVRGYNVAAAERHGVGYAVTSDVSDDELTHMLVAAATP